MATVLTTPAEVPGGSPVRPLGLLALASPAPDGWETGGLQVETMCSAPRISVECGQTDPEPAKNPVFEEFFAFTIEESSGCSTISSDGRAEQARAALEASTDYALGVVLKGSAVSPNLNDAESLGDFPSAAAALAALECHGSTESSGQAHVIHATPAAAVFLRSANLLTEQNRTPSGAPVIVSAGYGCDVDVPQLWVTGRVWAAAGAIDVREGIDRRTNNREAWATRSAIVGFNSCINQTATFAGAPSDGGGDD